MVRPFVALVACLGLAATAGGVRADPLAGPVAAEVVRVVDGDTIRVRALIWLDLSLDVLVRIRGIDAPELNGDCEGEETLAEAATQALTMIVGDDSLQLRGIDDDKYFGRVVADVVTTGGIDLGGAMLEAGFVRPYDGGARLPWCPMTLGALGP